MRTLLLLAALVTGFAAMSARAETTLCTQITSIPFVINTTGTYCLKSDLATNATSGNMITINANNVVIDLNSFKLGGAGGGPATTTVGIFANERRNVTIRNGTIRGFHTGIHLYNSNVGQTSHLIEDVLIDLSTVRGLYMFGGSGNVVRNNRISQTGSASASQAVGIDLNSAFGAQIVGNMVNAVKAAPGFGTAMGILISYSERIHVTDNLVSAISAMSSGTTTGIHLLYGRSLVLERNTMINSGVGLPLILDETLETMCIDNRSMRWTTTVDTCTVHVGNQGI